MSGRHSRYTKRADMPSMHSAHPMRAQRNPSLILKPVAAFSLLLLALVAGCVQFPEASKYRIEPNYEFDVKAGPSQIKASCNEGKLAVVRTLSNKSLCRVECKLEANPTYKEPWQCELDLPESIEAGATADINIQCKGASQSAGCEKDFDYRLSVNCKCNTEDLDAIDQRLAEEGRAKLQKTDGSGTGITDGSSGNADSSARPGSTGSTDAGSKGTPGRTGNADGEPRSAPGSSGAPSGGSDTKSPAPGNIDGGL